MSYDSIIESFGPQFYYRLNESSGAVAKDYSGNGNTGMLSGVVSYGQPGAIAGDPDTSITFSATGGVTVPNSLNYTTWLALSSVFWINISTWKFVAITCNGPTITVYVGAAVDGASGGQVEIDKLFDWAGYNGQAGLAKWAGFNTVLTPAQVTTLYGAQQPPPPDLGNVASDPYGNAGSANQGSPLYGQNTEIVQMAGRRPSGLQIFEMPIPHLVKWLKRRK